MLLRRLRRAVLCASPLYLGYTLAAGAAEGSKDAAQPFSLFVDISNSRLADAVDFGTRRRLDIAGVPLVVGGPSQDDSEFGIAAGIAGSYGFDFGDHLTLKASGSVSRVHTAGSGLFSGGRIGGDTAISYRWGSSGFLLRPSLRATLRHDVLERMDYGLESKMWHAFGPGVDLTATLGHSWRVAALLASDSRETARGKLGLDIDLFDGSSVELAYGFDSADGPLASQFGFTQGPTIALHLALGSAWRVQSGYGLAATRRGYSDADPNARWHDLRHRLQLKSTWEIPSPAGAAWLVSATYDYERTTTDDPATVPDSHSAMLNFALKY